MNRAQNDISLTRKTFRSLRLVAGLLALALVIPCDGDESPQRPVSVPVMLLKPPTAQQPLLSGEAEMSPLQTITQPTLPDGKLPQYQQGSHQRRADLAADPDDARLRLLMALPTEPILIEATITIDGQPFRQARQKRIAALLEAASATDSAATNSNRVTPEAGTSDEENDDVVEDPPQELIDNAAQEEADDAAREPVMPPTVAAYSLATTAEQVLRRYQARSGGEVSPEEVRWLLTNWVDGPIVLLLNENFQRFRADERPVFDILDRDRDGVVSAVELEQSVASLRECDLNRDDIVGVLELAQVADDPRQRAMRPDPVGTTLVPLPDEDTAAAVYHALALRYADRDRSPASDDRPQALVPRFDTNGDGHFDAAECEALQQASPDLALTVTFDTRDPGKSSLTIMVSDGEANVPVGAGAVSVQLRGTPVVVSALQAAASDQVSLGAVADGYPILPDVDPDDDGRLTLRELRGLPARLTRFDRDGDGQLSGSEVQAPVRLCIGLGPLVHGALSSIRSHPQTDDTPRVTPPAWFARMDRNNDDDLTRREFPGDDAQFAALDADGDQLVSAREAAEFEASATPGEERAGPPAQNTSESNE